MVIASLIKERYYGQYGDCLSHQASLLPEERSCNRPPVLGTATL
ncbi:hypothetical protein [Segatella copri]|nr:hypothetical protein [Segatella copri]